MDQLQQPPTGTIVEAKNIDPQSDADSLRDAMIGLSKLYNLIIIISDSRYVPITIEYS